MRRLRAVVPIVAVVLTSACGVTSEDEPQPIEDSTSQHPGATPSVDTETGLMPPASSSMTPFTTTPTYPPSATSDPALPDCCSPVSRVGAARLSAWRTLG
jgi:hypothetical protein